MGGISGGHMRAAAKSPAPAASATAAPRGQPAEQERGDAFAREEKQANAADKAEGTGSASTPMTVRTNFAALAAVRPQGDDPTGTARIGAGKAPDSLTRYRVMAVAVQGENRFGSAESTVTARLPLMVRPSRRSRFLNFGDKFEMPIVVQNQTDAPMDVDVAMRALNANVTGPGRRVTVPANDRVEVRIPAAAAKAGTARFQIGVASGRFSDANQLTLTVWTPATTEAFATYGTIDDGAIAQPVKMPSDVVPQVRRFGGHDVVDRPPGADRARALPRPLISSSATSRSRRASSRSPRSRTCSALSRRRTALAGGPPRQREEGHRPPEIPAIVVGRVGFWPARKPTRTSACHVAPCARAHQGQGFERRRAGARARRANYLRAIEFVHSRVVAGTRGDR